MARILNILVLILWVQTGFTQERNWKTVESKSDIYSHQRGSINKNEAYSISNTFDFTAIVIQINNDQKFEGAFVELEGETYVLALDEHANLGNGLKNSNLISFNNPISGLKFHSNSIQGGVSFHFINGESSDPLEHKVRNFVNDCFVEPESISQSTWRNGLTAPSFNRSFTNVEHLIIHHSAGSNTNTNYQQVVRDIYIYHTEVNGWSDIGYNYLIAQDGTIFKGRDPDDGEQDNVRGAHFCGKNSATMGVCLLGNYTSVQATNESIASLMNLLSWKLDKNGLNPFESFNHSNSELGTIVGHRDGCATECPGTTVYSQIEDFKKRINNQIENCYTEGLDADFLVENIEIETNEAISFTDNSLGEVLEWNWEFDGANFNTSISQNPNGISYSEVGEYSVQLIIRNGSRTDTAIKSQFIKVIEPSEITISNAYPNPIDKGGIMTIEFDSEKVNKVEISDLSGNLIDDFITQNDEIKLNTFRLNSGLYLVRYFDSEKVTKSQKIIILN